MSLESYKKAIEAQKARNAEFRDEAKPMPEESKQQREPEYVYVENQPRKRRSGCLIFFVLLIALFAVAAIKNPSENESKELVKSFIVEKVNDKLRDEVTSDENDGMKQFGALLGMTFASNIIDYVCDFEVNDYVVFTTFDCTIKVDDSKRTIVSGVILFGKIIPLKTDIKEEYLQK